MSLLHLTPALEQVTIKNPDHLPVPEPEVQVLLNTTCQVVAWEFHVKEKDGVASKVSSFN